MKEKITCAETRSVPTELSEGEQTTMFQAAFAKETNFFRRLWNRVRPLPVAEEGSMRFCEEQAIQANAQKRADSEQRTQSTTAARGRRREYEIL